uniref:Dynamin-type G domain-containing protein n=1 Tax=Sinocyclocheilus grahami TaxID=75366 RepID=A0A672SVF0_SINGR
PSVWCFDRSAHANKAKIFGIKDLIEKFIKRQDTISLVVVPANIDIATTEALQMAFRVDSTGQRTLGILTKPDLLDKGMEETVVRTVNNQVIQLKKGYMIVKCRGQQDINEKLDLIKALEKERRFFFNEHSHFRQVFLLRIVTQTIALENGKMFVRYILVYRRRSKKLRVFTKIRKEFAAWKRVLDDNHKEDEVEQYVRTRRGKELSGFVNYRTFENIVKKHIEEQEEPALKLLKDVTDIVPSCVNRIIGSHFKAFSHLLRAAKEPVEDFLDDRFQRAEEKIHSQFKMERIVYSQDHLYSSHLETVKQKQSQTVLGHRAFVSADVREMAQHLTAYFTITSDRLANQIPLIVQYHMLDQYISRFQNAMLAMIGRNNPGILLQEDCAVARKVLSKFVHLYVKMHLIREMLLMLCSL